MLKIKLFLVVLLLPATILLAQETDSVSREQEWISPADTSFDEDVLFRDFASFMDSLLAPRSYFLVSVSVERGFYSFESKNTQAIETHKKLVLSPLLAYYHKAGWGVSFTGNMIHDGNAINFYQGSFTGSYDHLTSKKMATGISISRYITKKNLSFYTSPLQNELYGYFTWRKSWIKPTLAASYGWGSRTDYQERELLIQDLRLRRRGFIYINTKEAVNDFSLLFSVRHDFYWRDVLAQRDVVRFTPQLNFTSGTQRFGMNQSTNTYATLVRNNATILYSSDQYYLDDQLRFQPLAATALLRGEYDLGRFFLQPQLAFEYYFPSSTQPFTATFSMHIGCMF